MTEILRAPFDSGVTIDQKLSINGFEKDPVNWLQQQWNNADGWLLAFSNDGIMWGKCTNGEIVFADETGNATTNIAADKLQQISLFGESEEIRLWKDRETWCACKLSDATPSKEESFDEKYILWGDKYEQNHEGFVSVTDGQQGLKHIPPIENVPTSGERSLYLKIRNYIGYDENLEAYIKASRLVNFSVDGGK